MTTTTATTAAALAAAWKVAQPGDVILLGDNLSQVSLSARKLDPPVTLKGGSFKITDGSYAITLASGTSGVVIDGVKVTGPGADGVSAPNGAFLSARGVSNVTVKNCIVDGIRNGIYHDQTDHLTIDGCKFYRWGEDAIRGGAAGFMTITNNLFSSPARTGNTHPDCVQFWTTNTTTYTHDLVIDGNLFDRGDGTPAQGVFLGNEWNLAYYRVTITNNVLFGMMPNGISIDKPRDNCLVADNIVLGYSDMASKIRAAHEWDATAPDAINLTVRGNRTSHYVWDAQAAPAPSNLAGVAFDKAPVVPQLVSDKAGVLSDPSQKEALIRAAGKADLAGLPPLVAPKAPPTLEEQLAALQAQRDADEAADATEDAAYEARIADLSAQLDTAQHALGDAGSLAKAKDAAIADLMSAVDAANTKLSAVRTALDA